MQTGNRSEDRFACVCVCLNRPTFRRETQGLTYRCCLHLSIVFFCLFLTAGLICMCASKVKACSSLCSACLCQTYPYNKNWIRAGTSKLEMTKKHYKVSLVFVNNLCVCVRELFHVLPFENMISRVAKGSCLTHSVSFCLIFCVLLSDYVMGHEVHLVCIACTAQPIGDQGSVNAPDPNVPITSPGWNCWDGHYCAVWSKWLIYTWLIMNEWEIEVVTARLAYYYNDTKWKPRNLTDLKSKLWKKKKEKNPCVWEILSAKKALFVDGSVSHKLCSKT